MTAGAPPARNGDSVGTALGAVADIKKCQVPRSTTSASTMSFAAKKRVVAKAPSVQLKIPLRPRVPQVTFDNVPNVDDAITVCSPTRKMAGIRLLPGTAHLVQIGAKLEYRVCLQMLRVELEWTLIDR